MFLPIKMQAGFLFAALGGLLLSCFHFCRGGLSFQARLRGDVCLVLAALARMFVCLALLVAFVYLW